MCLVTKRKISDDELEKTQGGGIQFNGPFSTSFWKYFVTISLATDSRDLNQLFLPQNSSPKNNNGFATLKEM